MEWYDWNKTFSYSHARWVIVISARGYGKTYGLRKQCVRDYIKKKRRFVEVVRHQSEIADVGRGYFEKLDANNEFPDHEFKYQGERFYIRKAGTDDEWQLIGYVVALTNEQKYKKMTFANVKRFIFDEGLIEHKDRYKRYLPREFQKLDGLRSSITRETPEDPSDSVVYVLGNAVDYTCPLLEALGIRKIPDYGRHVYNNGDVLLDYVEPIYYDEYVTKTAIGRAMADGEGKAIFGNEFLGAHEEYVEPKPKHSKFWRGYKFQGHTFALWIAPDNYCYVTDKAPARARLKAFTLDDDSINYDLIRKSGNDAKQLRTLFYRKFMRYESAVIRERYSDMLLSLGIV